MSTPFQKFWRDVLALVFGIVIANYIANKMQGRK